MKYLTEFIIVLFFVHRVTMLNKAYISSKPSCNLQNQSFVPSINVSLKKSKLSFAADLITSIPSGLQIEMEFFNRKPTSNSYQSIYRYSLDMCSALKARTGNMLVLWITKLDRFGNIALSCPIPKGHYFVRDFPGSELFVPSFLFPGQYRLTIIMYAKEKSSSKLTEICECKFPFEVKSK